jgi:hypothetical protein
MLKNSCVVDGVAHAMLEGRNSAALDPLPHFELQAPVASTAGLVNIIRLVIQHTDSTLRF